jgi:hypothetical protein
LQRGEENQLSDINLQQNAKMTTTEPDENLGPCLDMKKIMHAFIVKYLSILTCILLTWSIGQIEKQPICQQLTDAGDIWKKD